MPGWQEFVIDPLTGLVTAIAGGVGGYAIAIILITLAIRLLLLPLTMKGMRAQRKMQTVQPMLQAARARWAASPLSAQRTEAAIELSSAPRAGFGCPYHSESFPAVHSSVLSRWQRLQAFGFPEVPVTFANGLLMVWLRTAFSNPSEVWGI